MNFVSTCEELSYPHYKYPELAHKIDELAKKNDVTVLGTGINPGYLMDTLPITLTGPCQEVKKIKVTRMLDSSKRRVPYQKKIGTGLSREEFKKMIEEKKITGHVGLIESIAMIADALGWKLDEIKELHPECVIADRKTITPYTIVKPGQVAGLKSVAYGIKQGKRVITLEFVSYAGLKEEYDAISIEGVPNIYQKIEGGVHGDIGTVATIINSIPKVINANPGLVTMKDLPLPSAVTEDVSVHVERRET
jgi:4-hydroxy-tetrahydrodipicolinate reductase